jgi:nucleotide-binding universal stress UspA family protein
MFSNVLVGVDGGAGGRDAIALTQQLAPRARRALAHVYSTGRMPKRGTVLALPFDTEDSQRLLEAEKMAAGLNAELITTPRVPPGRGLHELAAHRGVDLLVVGSSRHAGMGHVLMGDDARGALNGAPCAVAIAPRGYAQHPRPLRRIGVGYDGSEESRFALAIAREITVHGEAVRALWVASPRAVRRAAEPTVAGSDAIRVALDRRIARLRELPGVDGSATYGDVRQELAAFSQELDLLVTGSRGRGPLGRLVHGSVSSYLVRHAACALLVLPRPAVRKSSGHARARADALAGAS